MEPPELFINIGDFQNFSLAYTSVSISCSCLNFAMITRFVLCKGICHNFFIADFFTTLFLSNKRFASSSIPRMIFNLENLMIALICSRVRSEIGTLKSPVTSYLITLYSSSSMGCIYLPLLLLIIIAKIKKYMCKFIA